MQYRIVAVCAGAVWLFPGSARGQECFPACRDGFECRDGACVPVAAVAPATECFPACRAGFACHDGTCTPVDQEPRKPRPETPPTPPRFEVALQATLAGTLFGADDPVNPTEGLYYVRRTLFYGGRVMFREAGNAWFAVGVGIGFIHKVRVQDLQTNSGDSTGVQISAEQVIRIPIAESGGSYLVDKKASLDLSAGGYLIAAEKKDFGAIVRAELSFFWLHFGPELSFGAETALSVGLGGGLRVSF